MTPKAKTLHQIFPSGNTSGHTQRAKGSKTTLDTKSPPVVMVKPETPCKLFTVTLIAVPYNKQANKADSIANHPDDPKLSSGLNIRTTTPKKPINNPERLPLDNFSL